MFATLLAAIGGIKTYLLGAIGIAAATALAVLWLQVSAARDQLAAAKVDLERLTQKTIAQEIVIGAKADAVDELERANAELSEQSAALAATLQEIRDAKPEDDGKVAPILERTLRRLGPDGLRK